MKIEFDDLKEYIGKAALYDAIVNYCRSRKYIDSADILNFAGLGADQAAESGEEENDA